jgi:hypothetical protein
MQRVPGVEFSSCLWLGYKESHLEKKSALEG